MRNSFDDLYANSLAFREAEKMRRESANLLTVRQQAITDLIAGQTSARWNDFSAQNALRMSDLVSGIDRITGAEAMKSINGLNAVSKVSEMIAGTLSSQSFLVAAEAANASIAKILMDTQAGIKFSQLESIISKEWTIPRESLVKGFIEAAHLTKFESNLSSIAAMSSITERLTHGFNGRHLGELLGVSEKLSNSLAAGFAGLSTSYQNLFESFEENHQRMLSLRPALVRMPTVEYYNSALLTQAVTSAEFDDFDVADDDSSESLEYFLAQLNPHFVRMLKGARTALTSSNPDRVRHFSASLRELLTHVLHTLAPDHEIRGWSSSPQDFDKGRPTRKARLRYIYREIDHAAFGNFVVKDIDAVLECFQLFHEGTHAIAVRFSDEQLKAFQNRVESAMRFLCEIASRES